jgi:hypothetical protein
MVIHSDSTSAIVRANHTGAGPGQQHAVKIQKMVTALKRKERSVAITWVKGHAGVPENERADVLAGKAAGRIGQMTIMSIAHLKLRISERLRKAKGAGTITPPTMGPRKYRRHHPRSPVWIGQRIRSRAPRRKSGQDIGDLRFI